MKVVHWVMQNGSGMHNVAKDICEAEIKLGVDSHIVDYRDEKTWIWDGDINVSHTHIPDVVQQKNKGATVWIGHGSPEHVFQTSVEISLGYGHSDSWMLCQRWLKVANACVTFWPRHQKLWQSMCQRGREVECLPLGVNKEFWKPTPSRGKYAGEPSLFFCDNQHYVKWALPLWFVWGSWIRPVLPKAVFHNPYTPHVMHRWVYPLCNSNDTSYGSYISPQHFSHEELRNAFNSVDFHIGLVQYGECNRVSLEANASGCTTISYRGNPYSDYWIDEGDHFEYLVPQLLDILQGKTEKREKSVVPDISETAKGMIEVYNKL